LSKMNLEHKNFSMQTDLLNRLRDEIRAMDSDIMSEEAALGDFKRTASRMWVGLKFSGLLECCEKGTVRVYFLCRPTPTHIVSDSGGIWETGRFCESCAGRNPVER